MSQLDNQTFLQHKNNEINAMKPHIIDLLKTFLIIWNKF